MLASSATTTVSPLIVEVSPIWLKNAPSDAVSLATCIREGLATVCPAAPPPNRHRIRNDTRGEARRSLRMEMLRSRLIFPGSAGSGAEVVVKRCDERRPTGGRQSHPLYRPRQRE